MALKSGRVGIHPSQVDPITGMLLNGPTPGSISFEDLSDAQISNPEVGQTLIYNGTGWENEFSSISPVTPATLASLQDVAISSAQNKQILQYDGTAAKWENEDLPSIPSKTSDLQNDSGFITISSVPTKTSDLQNDSGFITISSVPTKTSDLQNDSGFITSPGYVWTSGVSALAGATTATITDDNITANSTIEVFASVQGLPDPELTVSTGSCVLTFAALAQNTTFKLRISN